jgi:cytochrome c-type biogenesis protein CcmH/NrfF
VLALALALLALAAPVAGAATCPRTTLGDVENEVMCPVCGTPLALATEAPQAERERALIQRLVDDCRSKEEIKEVLVAEFGDDVLSLPGDDGFDLAAYVVPALIVLLGGGAVAAAALAWRRTRPRRATAAAAPDDAVAKRLVDDMERYDL